MKAIASYPLSAVLSDEKILEAMQTAHPEGEEAPMWVELKGRLRREVRNVAKAQLAQTQDELKG